MLIVYLFSEKSKIAENSEATAPVESNNSTSEPVADCSDVVKLVDGDLSVLKIPKV